VEISENFPNFDNWTIPKLSKMKSLENSVFRQALLKNLKRLLIFHRIDNVY